MEERTMTMNVSVARSALTAQQLAALSTAPIVVVLGSAARLLILLYATLDADNTATPWNTDGADLEVGYEDGPSLIGLRPQVLVGQTEPRITGEPAGPLLPATRAACIGRGLVLRNEGAPLVGGTGSAVLSIYYLAE
jgi:hypothetical protein